MSWSKTVQLCATLIAVLVAITLADNSFSCTGKKDGNYANPRNCSTYFACSGPRLFLMPCPAGLHYNQFNDSCDYPELVDCDDSNLCAGQPNGNIADPENCGGYIACVNEISIRMPCPANLHYDAVNDRCDYPHNVKCAVNPETSQPPLPEITTKPETTTAPETTITPVTTAMPESTESPHTATTPSPSLPVSCVTNPPGVYPDPTNCTRFVVCLGLNKGLLKSCPSKHLNFNPTLKVCVWSNTYTCIGPNFCVGKDDGDYKDINNCFGYVSCTAGLGYPRNCPLSHMKFNGTHCV